MKASGIILLLAGLVVTCYGLFGPIAGYWYTDFGPVTITISGLMLIAYGLVLVCIHYIVKSYRHQQ